MTTDPTPLYRLRDGVYAPDLLIVAVAELDLFSWLRSRGRATAGEVAEHFALHARPVDVLLTYLTALGLLEREGTSLRPTALAADHLVDDSPFSLRAYYASLRERPGCKELLTVLESGRPASWASAEEGTDWAARLADPAFAGSITAAMDARGRHLGPALATAIADVPCRRLLDVGGSSGTYAGAILETRSGAEAAVYERPPVDVAARTLLADRGYADRIEVIAGDMFEDPLPGGFDVHLYSHVLHDWDEPRVRHLLQASYAALPPGGHLVDHDVHVNADKTGPLAAAEYSVFLMHSTPGKCWSVGELAQFLS